jgi:hypothetical protein
MQAIERDVNHDLKREQGALASLLVADQFRRVERVDEEPRSFRRSKTPAPRTPTSSTRKNNREQRRATIETLRKEADDQDRRIEPEIEREKARTQATIEDYRAADQGAAGSHHGRARESRDRARADPHRC